MVVKMTSLVFETVPLIALTMCEELNIGQRRQKVKL